jgi:hypothetical protein
LRSQLFCFRRYACSFVLSPAPFGIPIAVGTAMLVSLWRFHTHRSAAALAGFAALAGIGATELHLLHVAGLGAVLAIVLALRRPRVEAALLALTLCLFLVPTAPSLEQLLRSTRWGKSTSATDGSGRDWKECSTRSAGFCGVPRRSN